jgi:hypothetical protein
MERNRYSLPTDSRDPWVSNGFFLLDVSTLWWREEYTAYGAGARIRIRLHIRVRCRGSPLDENTSSSRDQDERSGRAAAPKAPMYEGPPRNSLFWGERG